MGYALITGASSGIGLELAKLCAKNGHNVILVARNGQRLIELKERLKRYYKVKVIVVSKDLTKRNAVREIYDYLQKECIKVDFLINNAGIGDRANFLGSEWKKQKYMIDLNISSLVEMTYLFGNAMKDRGYGRILNLSSLAAFTAGPEMAIYYAIKAFVRSFSEAIAEELRESGITVTALCPGPTATNFKNVADMEHSRMFNSMKAASPRLVAAAGYRAAMKGKVLQYYGMYTYGGNIAFRFLPRCFGRKIAMSINKNRNT